MPSPPVKIVALDHVARMGGAEICFARLLAATDEIEATAVLAEDGPWAEMLTAAGARVEILPLAERVRGMTRAQVGGTRARVGAIGEVARYSVRLARRLRELRPDVVHANTLKAGTYGTPAARLARIPSVWYLQDNLAPEHLPTAVVAPMRLLVSSLPDALVTPSHDTLRNTGGWRRPGLRTAVIPLPVPIPDQANSVRPEVLRVGVVGRLTWWKGQHVFLDAFARAFPDGPVRARLVGAALFGEHDYERDLRAQAQRLGVADRVDFAGYTDDVPAELRALDVFVHSSVLADPLANAALEAMAFGLPVIAARAGGPGEYVAEGRDGLLHAPGDVGELAGALRRLAEDRALRERLAAGARAKAAEFSAQALAPRMVALYRELAAHRHGSSR